MATSDSLVAYIEPYRGKRGELKRKLGSEGLRILWIVCNGSPATACEWLGYDPRTQGSNLSKEWRSLGLETQKREPWGGDDGMGMTTDDWRAQMCKIASQREKAPIFDWDVPRGHEYVPLVGVSCLHYGNKDMDYPRWLALRDWIKDNPEVRWVGLGDYFDRVMKEDVGALNFGEPPLLEDVAREDMEPIVEQCFGLCIGNHEGRLAKKMGYDENPVKRLAKDLGVYYYGMEGFLRVRLTKAGTKQAQTYDGRVHHGWGSARTPGGQVNKLRDLAIGSDVDFGMMGHTHSSLLAEFRKFCIDEEGYVTAKGSPFVFCGTMKKSGRGSFDRMMGYPPAALGAGTIHLYVNRHSAHARS